MPRQRANVSVPQSLVVSRNSRNSVAALANAGRSIARNVRRAPRPAQRRRAPRNQVARNPSRPSLVRPLLDSVKHQIDRLINPRVHYGEVQPRASAVPGILNSTTKTIVNITSTALYKVVIASPNVNEGVYLASSALATTDFADAAVTTGSSSYTTAQMERWCYSAGSLSVSLGQPATSAGGFVTVGSINSIYAATTTVVNTLDPGDLINAPGAVTMPMWDYMNKPWSGFARKIDPSADNFIDVAADQAGGVMVPFILFQIPTALVADFTAMVLSYNSYDFVPEMQDASVPALTAPSGQTDISGYRYATHLLAGVASGFVPELVATLSNGAVGQTMFTALQNSAQSPDLLGALSRLALTL